MARRSCAGSLHRFLTGWRAYFRHGNSTVQFATIDHFVNERMMLFISKKHQRDGRWYGRRVLYNSPEPARTGRARRNRVGTETESLELNDVGEPGGSWERSHI